MSKRIELEKAIADLDAQRALLGDATVDAAIAGIRMQLASLVPTPKSQVQRKQATILFADISGFTAMSESMDAEDVQETMNALWGQVDRAITDHNGRIDKHIGDAVMALWGTDETREDDAEQAIRAALALQTAVHTFAAERNAPLKMRIGINTGPVFLGEVGTTAEFTAMGNTVNTASRLEQAAPVGGILISHATFRHVRGIFDVSALEPMKVKGITEPLHVYVVERAKSRTFRMSTRGVEGIETKTIGRENELNQLQTIFHTAVSERTTTVVSLVGEAGVGKSRLLYEFDKWIEMRPERIGYFRGRATQQTQGVPHHLLRDLLADRFQILDSDPLAIVRQKFVNGLSEFLPKEATMKAHVLGAWLGYDFSDSPEIQPIRDEPEQLKNRATLYLAQLFAASGDDAPTIVLLEDIHWADGGSLDVLVDLARRRPQLPLLIVCLARPTLYERRPTWGDRIPEHTRLDLAPLSTVDTRALVTEILRLANPPSQVLIDLVSTRAAGNPFYAEELIKMLIDDGVILTEEEAWHVVPEQLLDLKVPTTLTGVLQARLDKLHPEEKLSLQQASVIGLVFWDKALAALPEDGHLALPALQAKEFAYLRQNSAFVGTLEYIFKHAILRDVTYETVLKRLRRSYHALVADWMVSAAEANERSDEYAALIAEHFQLAEEVGTAAFWYGRAGQLAAATFAHEEAVRFLTLALDLAPDDDPLARFDLLQSRSEAYEMQGSREEQRQDLEQLQIVAMRLTESQQARAALRWARYSESTNDYTQAQKYAQDATEFGQCSEDMSLVAEGHWAWGNALWRQGQYQPAERQFETGLQLATKTGDQKQVANCLNGLGIVAYFQGDFSTATLKYDQALAIRREINDRYGEGSSLNNLGIVANDQGDFASAKNYYEQALAIKQEMGNREGEGTSLNNLGLVVLNQGDYASAKRYYQQSLAIDREIGSLNGEAISLVNLASVAMDEGDFSTALGYYQQSLDFCREIGDRMVEGINLHNLGALAFTEASYPLAEDYYLQALSIRQELNLPYYIVEDWAGLAQLKLTLGDRRSAQYFVQQCLDYLNQNPHLDGAEHPMRTFHLTWQVLIALDQSTEADGVLALAARIMQEYLDKNSDPAMQKMYLRQPHHSALWAAWSG